MGNIRYWMLGIGAYCALEYWVLSIGIKYYMSRHHHIHCYEAVTQMEEKI